MLRQSILGSVFAARGRGPWAATAPAINMDPLRLFDAQHLVMRSSLHLDLSRGTMRCATRLRTEPSAMQTTSTKEI